MLPAILGLGASPWATTNALCFARRTRGLHPVRSQLRDRDQLRRLTTTCGGIRPRNLPSSWTRRAERSRGWDRPNGRLPRRGALRRPLPQGADSAIEAARANGEAIAIILAEVGINVDCLPLLDCDRRPLCIGDRASRRADAGRGARPCAARRLAAGGSAACVKHLPGQRRAAADSHVELPVRGPARRSWPPTAPIPRPARRGMGMIAHVLYPVWRTPNAAPARRRR